MKLISHRGNIAGDSKEEENSPAYINHAITHGVDVEIDVWFIKNEWFLGHDKPQYNVTQNFILNPKFWCHAKNKEALFELQKYKDVNYFWHDTDLYTLTSKGYIWCNINVPLLESSICVMPEKGINGDITKCSGICSDYIIQYR
jgi:hypothetical protein